MLQQWEATIGGMDTNGHQTATGIGDAIERAPHRSDLGAIARTLQSHIDNRYALTPTMRQEMVDQARHLAMKSSSERVQVAALRVLALLDQVNVRREANEVAGLGHELAASTQRVRAALATPEGRAAMVAVTAAACGQSAQNPMPEPIPEVSANENTLPTIEVKQGEGWASAGGDD